MRPPPTSPQQIDRAFRKRPQKAAPERQAMMSGGGEMKVRGQGAAGKSDAFTRSVIAALMKTRPGPFALMGRVLVSFEISPSGTLNYVHVVHSSGNRAIDKAAVDAIHKAKFEVPAAQPVARPAHLHHRLRIRLTSPLPMLFWREACAPFAHAARRASARAKAGTHASFTGATNSEQSASTGDCVAQQSHSLRRSAPTLALVEACVGPGLRRDDVECGRPRMLYSRKTGRHVAPCANRASCTPLAESPMRSSYPHHCRRE